MLNVLGMLKRFLVLEKDRVFVRDASVRMLPRLFFRVLKVLRFLESPMKSVT